MLYVQSLYGKPSPELEAFLSSHKSFGQAWQTCQRSDWMLWMVHHKTGYGNTAKLIQFADLYLLRKPDVDQRLTIYLRQRQMEAYPAKPAFRIDGEPHNEWLEALDLCLARVERSIEPDSVKWTEAKGELKLKQQAEQLRQFLDRDYLAAQLW